MANKSKNSGLLKKAKQLLNKADDLLDDSIKKAKKTEAFKKAVKAYNKAEDFVEDKNEDHSVVKHENKYTVHVIDGEDVVETINEDGDSVKHVKIITKRGGGIAHADWEMAKDKKVIIRHSGDMKEDILYIVDGVKYTDKQFINKIEPDNIESMSVVKGDDIRKYTDGDYEGVIIITSKKSKKK